MNQRDHKRKMRASHHECVNAFREHWLQCLLQDAPGYRRLEVTAFNLPYKPRACGFKNPDFFGETFHHRGIQLSMKGGGRRQHAHFAAQGLLRGWFDRRLHADERKFRIQCPQVL